MRILIVNSLFRIREYGGAERSVSILAKAFVTAGHDVNVIALTESREPLDVVFDDGVASTFLPLNNLYWPFPRSEKPAGEKLLWHVKDVWNRKAYRRALEIIDRVQPDLLFSNIITGFSVSIWSAAQTRGVPVVHALRDFYLLCPKSSRFSRGGQCQGACWTCNAFAAPKRLFTKDVSAVIGISQYMLSTHEHLWSNDAIQRVIWNPVEKMSKGMEEARTRRRLAFGMLGRFIPEKGFVGILERFTKRRNVDADILVGGDGNAEIERRIREIATGDERVTWNGRVAADQFYRRIDVLIVPSLWAEPFGRVVAEAQMAGVPCVVRRVGGLPELVEEGRTGWLFDIDEDAIALLERLTADPGQADTAKAHCATAAGRYTVDNVASAYLSLFSEVLTNRESSRIRIPAH